jgi:hypothetical protein
MDLQQKKEQLTSLKAVAVDNINRITEGISKAQEAQESQKVRLIQIDAQLQLIKDLISDKESLPEENAPEPALDSSDVD